MPSGTSSSPLSDRLRDPGSSGVYRASAAAPLLAAAAEAGMDVARIRLDEARGKSELLDAIAAALEFPDWFGGNWDALEDCLTDLDWRGGAGHVLVFEAAEAFRVDYGDDWRMLVEVLEACARDWSGRGAAFFAAFVGVEADAGLPELDAGGGAAR